MKFMKKIMQMVLLATAFAACQSKSDLNTNKDMIVTDTSAMYRSNMMTDTGSVIQTTTLKNGTTPMGTAAAANRPVVINNYYGSSPNTGTAHRSTSTRRGAYASSGGTGSGTTTTTTTRRRGWSHGAKDAVIGGVGGAVAGAVIDKRHGQGALIGGVVGAAGGYILGHGKDKREGR
jgi:hypothetical protein